MFKNSLTLTHEIKTARLTQISICIPIYEQDIRHLAQSLLSQKEKIRGVKILFYDDGSSQKCRETNHWLHNEPNVKYVELGQNVGRAAIRNRLAASAEGEAVLFLDDDSLIDNPDFIKNYLKHNDGKTVICGGRKYTEDCPDEEHRLHWTYGSRMESKDAAHRNKRPNEAFHSNNFLIPKEIWKEVPFDENLKQYGHEDTLLGYELSRQGYPILHIDNEVIHGDLESNEMFLHKTRLAIQNLKYLYLRGNGDFNASVTLMRTFDFISKIKLSKFVAKVFAKNHEKWEEKLITAKRPSLRLFSFYKLSYLSFLLRKARESASI